MPRLLILHPFDMSGENHGLQVLHVDTLAELLSARGWTVDETDPLDPRLAAATLSADVLLIHMMAVPEIEAIVRLRRERGLPTVYELTDNFLGMDEWAPIRNLLRSPLLRQHILHYASMSDAVQVYAPGLAELFSRVNKRVIAFDPYVPIPERLPDKPPGFVVGWGGTRSHEADLAAIAPAIVRFLDRHRDARFAYMGDLEMFARRFGAIDPEQSSARPFADHDSYLRFVGGLHVGLGPQRPTSFNVTRTDWRFAAYAAHGVVAVLEDGLPYRRHRDRARLFRTPEELEQTLEELYRSPASVRDLAERGRAWALDTRSAEALAAQRDDAYRSLLRPGRTPTSATTPDASAATGDRAALEAATKLPPPAALESAREIVSAHPDYDQAHLLVARTLHNLERHSEVLDYVERLEPSAIYADLFAELQVLSARRVAPEAVARYTNRIASPSRVARLSAEQSVLDRSRAILEHQPYDYFSLASTIKLLAARDPDAEELDELYARACLVSPGDVPHDRRPPDLAPFLPA